MNAASAARMLLTSKALEAREEATMLLLSSKLATLNAEDLEEVVCNGSDEEVLAAVAAIKDMEP